MKVLFLWTTTTPQQPLVAWLALTARCFSSPTKQTRLRSQVPQRRLRSVLFRGGVENEDQRAYTEEHDGNEQGRKAAEHCDQKWQTSLGHESTKSTKSKGTCSTTKGIISEMDGAHTLCDRPHDGTNVVGLGASSPPRGHETVRAFTAQGVAPEGLQPAPRPR